MICDFVFVTGLLRGVHDALPSKLLLPQMVAYLHANGNERIRIVRSVWKVESSYATRKWRMLRYFSCSEHSTKPATYTKFHHLSAFWASLQSAALVSPPEA